MSAWRHHLLQQFPEFGHEPELWDLTDTTLKLGSLLERSAREGEREVGSRVLRFLLWADSQSSNDERFIYLCQDVLRRTVASPSLRPFFTSLLNRKIFSQLAGYVEYLASQQVLAEMAAEVRLHRHEA